MLCKVQPVVATFERIYLKYSKCFISNKVAACLLVVWLATYSCTWKRRHTSQLSRHLLLASTVG